MYSQVPCHFPFSFDSPLLRVICSCRALYSSFALKARSLDLAHTVYQRTPMYFLLGSVMVLWVLRGFKVKCRSWDYEPWRYIAFGAFGLIFAAFLISCLEGSSALQQMHPSEGLKHGTLKPKPLVVGVLTFWGLEPWFPGCEWGSQSCHYLGGRYEIVEHPVIQKSRPQPKERAKPYTPIPKP